MSALLGLSHCDDPATRAADWAALFARLGVAVRAVRKRLSREIALAGLSETEFLLLAACRQAPVDGLAQHALAASVGVSAAQVSAGVESLRASGRLTASRPSNDRRRQHWRLTPCGSKLFAELSERLSAWLTKLDAKLPAQRQSQFTEALCQLAAASETLSPRAALRAFDPSAETDRSRSGP